MALVDVLDFMPTEHPQRGDIIDILNKISVAIEKQRDPETGMWYQVTDLQDREGNYLESSGSIMFIYTWVKGALNGFLPAEFLDRFIKENADGTISVTDGVSVSGLGGEKNYRDGSFEYYISEPVRDDDPKAVGPFIMTSVLLDR